MDFRSASELLLVLVVSSIIFTGCLAGEPFDPEASVVLDPNGTTPLAARLDVEAGSPFRVMVKVEGGGESWTREFDPRVSSQSLPILGLKPDTSYSFTVYLQRYSFSSFRELTRLDGIVTAPLPEDFPEIVLESSVPDKREPGLTLFGVGRTSNYLVVVDEVGEVVWYYVPPEGERGAGDSRQLANGNFLFLPNGKIKEIDPLGNIIRQFKATAPGDDPGEGIIPVDDPGYRFHHEVYPTDWGTYLTLGFEVRTVEHFHTSETDPAVFGTVEVTDDTIIEFDADGVVQNRHAFLDILDPSRIAYDSLDTHFILGTGYDWVHANAVIPDARDDSLIVSLRHQDATVKLDRQTGQIKWILAPHENWSSGFTQYLLTPVGSTFEWSYHQHAPMLTPEGNVLLFDNGTWRASPYDGEVRKDEMFPEDNYSRAVEYRVDETNMTVEQVWEYGSAADPRLYSFFICDADHLPQTDNVWITFGGMLAVDDQTSEEMGRGDFQARLVEISRDGGVNEVVYDLSIFSDRADSDIGFTVYRSERIPGLYR
jgi:hypothetical protein